MLASKGKSAIRNGKAKPRVSFSPERKSLLGGTCIGLVGVSLLSLSFSVNDCHGGAAVSSPFETTSSLKGRPMEVPWPWSQLVQGPRHFCWKTSCALNEVLLECKFAEVAVFSKEEIKTATDHW